MKYFFKIEKEDKKDIKMANQSDRKFDLIFLDDKMYNRTLNKINYCANRNIPVCIAWEMKHQRKTFKVYKGVKIIEKKDKKRKSFFKKIEHMVTFSCENVEFYTYREKLVGMKVYRTKEKFKFLNKLNRAMKISRLSFDINNENNK